MQRLLLKCACIGRCLILRLFIYAWHMPLRKSQRPKRAFPSTCSGQQHGMIKILRDLPVHNNRFLCMDLQQSELNLYMSVKNKEKGVKNNLIFILTIQHEINPVLTNQIKLFQ